MRPKLEIACFHPDSAIIAQHGGADRVELCADASVGGITPAFDAVVKTRAAVRIQLVVMIRPRGGNFVYSKEEFEQMKKDIEALKSTGINGFVFGILTENGEVDKEKNKLLVQLAHPLSCTFHRAFDETKNASESLETIIGCGFKIILTSGHKTNAMEGIDELIALNEQSKGRIVIMPGGGVRSSNIARLSEKIKTGYYHSSAIIDNSGIANLAEVQSLREQLN